jgi:mono/diheme cytochrome c family protein
MKNNVISFPLIFILFFSLFSCDAGSDNKNLPKDKIKFRQYLVEGKRLYGEHCSNCHQEDGKGLVRLYPPLRNSDYFEKESRIIACLIKNGQKGEIMVNGISFNQPMPENPRLTNLEIAEIMTYIYATWGNKNRLFSHKEINEYLENCRQVQK